MPDAKQAAATSQETPEEKKPETQETPDDHDDVPDQFPLIDSNSDDSISHARLSNVPAETPNEQSISREKDIGGDDNDLKTDLVTGQSMDRHTEECTQAANSQTISQDVVIPDAQHLPRDDDHEEERQAVAEPCETPDEKADDEQGLVKNMGELTVTTDDHGSKDATESPSPAVSESSSANKGMTLGHNKKRFVSETVMKYEI